MAKRVLTGPSAPLRWRGATSTHCLTLPSGATCGSALQTPCGKRTCWPATGFASGAAASEAVAARTSAESARDRLRKGALKDIGQRSREKVRDTFALDGETAAEVHAALWHLRWRGRSCGSKMQPLGRFRGTDPGPGGWGGDRRHASRLRLVDMRRAP